MANKKHHRISQHQDDNNRRRPQVGAQSEQVANTAQAADLIARRPILGRQRQSAMRRINQMQGNRFAGAMVRQRQQQVIMRKDMPGYEGLEKETIDITSISYAPDYRGLPGGHITFTLQSGKLWTDIEQVFINGSGVDLAPEDANSGSSTTRVAVPGELFDDVKEIVVYFKGADRAGSTTGGGASGDSGGGGDGGGSAAAPQVDDSADSGSSAAPQNAAVAASGDGGSSDQGLADQAVDVLKMTREDLINHIETRRDELDIPSGSIGKSQFKKASDDGLRVLLRSMHAAEVGNEEQEDIVIEIAQRLVNASDAQETAALESGQTMQGALDVLRE